MKLIEYAGKQTVKFRYLTEYAGSYKCVLAQGNKIGQKNWIAFFSLKAWLSFSDIQ